VGVGIIHKPAPRTLATIICAAGLPLILAWLLVSLDVHSDLSGLWPSQRLADPATVLVGWADQDVEHAAASQSQGRSRMLGYMMDALHDGAKQQTPDGTAVQTFILMPEAGQFLHAAHRIPNEMVEVWLRTPAPFRHRSLIWASGLLQPSGNRQRGDKALYAMTDAAIEPADQRDITRWFRQ